MNMKTTLMTCNIFIMPLYQFRMITQDQDTLLEIYEEMLELIRDTGYKAVDVFEYEIDCFGVEKVKELLAKYDLTCSTYISCPEFDQIGANVERYISDAEALGTKIIMSNPRKTDTMEAMSVEEIHALMEEQWRRLVALAAEKDLHIVIEDMPELKFAYCKAEDVRGALDRVPGLEIVYDSGNMLLVKEDPVEFLKQFADKIGHVHLKDMMRVPMESMGGDLDVDGQKWNGAPISTGEVDLEAVVKTLKDIGYDGYVTVEFMNGADGDYRKTLLKSREYIEKLLQ